MMRMRGLLLVSCCVLASVLADAPSSGYAAPASSGQGYAAPATGGQSYAPAASYSSPQASYNEPTGYAAPATGYDAQPYDSYDNSYAPSYEEEADNGFGIDLSKFFILIPVFLAVLAAIIIAALIGPFIAQLGVIAVGILPGALSLKAPIINAILAPFSLTLCTPGNPPTLFPAAGRAFEDLAKSFDVDSEQAKWVEDIAYTVYNTIKDQYTS